MAAPLSQDSPKLKVAVLSIVPSPYQRDLFEALSQRPEIDLHVFYSEAGSPDSPWNQKAARSFETILPGFYLSWGGSRFLINKELPDLSSYDLLILNGYMMLAAQRLLRKWSGKLPILFWGERMVASFSGLKGWLRKQLAAPLNNIQGIVAIGRRAQDDYSQRFPQLPNYNLPYYCTLEPFQKNLPERPRSPITIFFCGQMIARKGVDILLDAFARLVEEGLNTRLLLVGREDAMNAKIDAFDESIRSAIHYAGFQQPEKLAEFFAQSDIFVLPSRYDGWGVVVNQAMGAGLPLVCSSTVGAGLDLIEEGKNGFVFESGDADSLHSCLKKLVDDPDFIARAGQASLAKAADWTPEAGAEKWIQIIRETCQKKN